MVGQSVLTDPSSEKINPFKNIIRVNMFIKKESSPFYTCVGYMSLFIVFLKSPTAMRRKKPVSRSPLLLPKVKALCLFHAYKLNDCFFFFLLSTAFYTLSLVIGFHPGYQSIDTMGGIHNVDGFCIINHHHSTKTNFASRYSMT